jgi:hypothetical protein
MHEEWKAVLGTDGRYEVSNMGNVRAIWYRTRGGNRWAYDPPRTLSPSPNKVGYRNLTSLVYADGSSRIKGIHVLVLEAFVGPRPDGMQAAHENGKAGDDRLENLSWKTPLENAADKIRHGTVPLRETRRGFFQCRKCLHWKPPTGFAKLYNPTSRCKRESECKDCRREYMRNYMYARAHGLSSAEEASKVKRPYRKAA